VVVKGAYATGAEAMDEGCATVVADAWAAGSMARGGVVAGEEAAADGADDDEADCRKENNDPTGSVPIYGIIMAVRSIGTLKRAAREAGRWPDVARPEEAALVRKAEAREIGEGGGGGQEKP
jgi:hypothetical protein